MQASGRINYMFKLGIDGENVASHLNGVHLMALGILDTMVPILCQLFGFCWNEAPFRRPEKTFDGLQ